MRKRKTNDETATEWNKRHRGNTLLRAGTASTITGSSSEITNRKGKLHPKHLHMKHLESKRITILRTTTIPADTQRRAREMRIANADEPNVSQSLLNRAYNNIRYSISQTKKSKYRQNQRKMWRLRRNEQKKNTTTSPFTHHLTTVRFKVQLY